MSSVIVLQCYFRKLGLVLAANLYSAMRNGQHVGIAKSPGVHVQGIQTNSTWYSEMKTKPWHAKQGKSQCPCIPLPDVVQSGSVRTCSNFRESRFNSPFQSNYTQHVGLRNKLHQAIACRRIGTEEVFRFWNAMTHIALLRM